jgi:hypothetical protein
MFTMAPTYIYAMYPEKILYIFCEVKPHQMNIFLGSRKSN